MGWKLHALFTWCMALLNAILKLNRLTGLLVAVTCWEQLQLKTSVTVWKNKKQAKKAQYISETHKTQQESLDKSPKHKKPNQNTSNIPCQSSWVYKVILCSLAIAIWKKWYIGIHSLCKYSCPCAWVLQTYTERRRGESLESKQILQ